MIVDVVLGVVLGVALFFILMSLVRMVSGKASLPENSWKVQDQNGNNLEAKPDKYFQETFEKEKKAS